MKNKKYFKGMLASLSALLLVGVGGTPVCYARVPEIVRIANLEQLVQWCNATNNGLGQLVQDIEVNRTVELKPLSGTKGLNAFDWSVGSGYGLRVMNGITLIVNHPGFEFGGEKELITVESGGNLVLKQGRMYVSEGNVAVVVKEGGRVTCENAFVMNGTIEDQNQPSDTIQPPDTLPTPNTVITSLLDSKLHLSCVVGERPDPSSYAATVYAYFGAAGCAELPVEWELSSVDFDTPSTYTVTGRLTEAALSAQKLSNPNNLTAQMTITVYEKGSVKNVRGEVLSVSASGNTVARLILPALPMGQVDAIYLYSSHDGVTWTKAVYVTPPDITVEQDNYLLATTTVGANSYVVYKYVTDYRPMWVRVEIVGSDRAGMSNAIQMILPEQAKPGDGAHNDSDEDAGDNSGDRGGGGQEETSRVIPPKTETVETPTKRISDPSTNQAPKSGASSSQGSSASASKSTAATTQAEQSAYADPQPAQVVVGGAQQPAARASKSMFPPLLGVTVILLGGTGIAAWFYLKRRR